MTIASPHNGLFSVDVEGERINRITDLITRVNPLSGMFKVFPNSLCVVCWDVCCVVLCNLPSPARKLDFSRITLL